MRLRLSPLAALVMSCCLFAACSDDKPATSVERPVVPQVSTFDTSGGGAPQTPPVGGDVDCVALKANLAEIVVNWQVVIGLTNSPSSEWGQIPLGSINEFGGQLAAASAALGGDADAAEALAYMSGANDIVERGLAGDAAAQGDLVTYMGTDIAANVGKQLPISIAYQNAGCD